MAFGPSWVAKNITISLGDLGEFGEEFAKTHGSCWNL
jgi:hypothetical protein